MNKALGAFCALVLAAASAAGATAKKAESSKGSDAEIESAIRERFAKSKIAVNNFTVSVSGGVATIDGRTNVIQHKGVATRLAKLGGAKSVNNRIAISDEARRKASANLEAGRRRAQRNRAADVNKTPPPRSEPRSENRLVDDKTPIRRAVVRWVR